jgi:hypothetical protein
VWLGDVNKQEFEVLRVLEVEKMPTFGKKSTVEDTMAALEDPLVKFHGACGGDIEDVALLFRAMSGQMLPPPMLCGLMGVSEEQMQGASRANPIRVSVAQLLTGVAAAMEETDTAAMYIDKIQACTDGVMQRDELCKLRAAVVLDEATALDIEARLLAGMQADTEMLEEVASIADLHNKWRENTDDISDALRFPTIVVGPQILSFEPMSMLHHSRVLSETEREQLFLRPGEDYVGLLRDKLAPMRKSSAEVAAAQRQVEILEASALAYLAYKTKLGHLLFRLFAASRVAGHRGHGRAGERGGAWEQRVDYGAQHQARV